MLLKKVSIFIDGNLRQRLTEKRKYGQEMSAKERRMLAQSFGHALAFPALLVQLLSSGYHHRDNLPSGFLLMWKFFNEGCEESRIYDHFRITHRMEATLSSSSYLVGLDIEIRFYVKGVKEPGYLALFSIGSEGQVLKFSVCPF